MASTRDGGSKKLRPGRAWSPWPATERPEGRDLPSAVAPLPSSPYELAGNDYHAAAKVVSTMASVQEVGVTMTRSAESARDNQAGVTRDKSGNDVGPSPTVRDNTESAAENKLLHSQDVIPRELSDSPAVLTRHTYHWTNDLEDEPLVVGKETTSGPSGGAAGDAADGSSVVGWAPGAAMPLVMSVAIVPGSLLVPNGRAMASAGDTMPPGSAGNVASELDVPEPASQSPRAPTDVHGDAMAANREAPEWAELLDGALHTDWEMVDKELRLLLRGLGRLADDTGGYGAGRMWHLGIGAAMALLLARRATYGRRRMFNRRLQRVLQVSGRRPVPFGPWPLGPQ